MTLTQFVDKPQPYDIHPGQRVMRLLGKVNSVADLSNAKTTTGNPALDNVDSGTLQLTANLLSNYPYMLHNVDPNAASAILDNPPSTSGNQIVAWEKDQNGQVKQISGDWFSEAVTKVVTFIGDILEHIKGPAKAVIKIALSVIGKSAVFF